MNKKIFSSLFLIFLLFLTGCQRYLGYGFVYWSDDEEAVPTGTPVRVITQSDINDIYLVSLPETKEKREFALWQVALFDSEEERDKALEAFTPFIATFAQCQQNLPLRERPDSSSENIYKLREGQVMKVIGREEEEVQIGSMTGRWYNLLTEDGVIGYTYDYYLTVFNESNGEKDVLNAREEEDVHLENVVNTSWRPEYFYDMKHGNRIDMNTFRDEYRLYIDGDNKTIYLKTKEREVSVNYEKISNTGYKKYAFLGTTFRIEIYSDYMISVQYNYDDREYKDAFVRLSTPVDELIREAQDQRDEQLFSFIDNGPVYSSSVYGDLEFREGGRFSWTKKSALISRKVISSAAGDNGRISFNLFPDSSISDKYTGGMTLIFGNGERLYLLFTVKNEGVQLLQIPDRYVNGESVVTADNFYDPISMHFTTPAAPLSSSAEENQSE
ncbi:MAG: SH3 domain-containing protein [Spirochaetales bacterium]|nr:SH3 domain-containing protein [Spirochaetales bacterium]